jgi:L-lactate utilization protein LutC
MSDIVTQKAGDLDANVRAWLEGLFGRSLNANEAVTVIAERPNGPAEGQDRDSLLASMNQFIEKAQASVAKVPAEEFESAVDEAIKHVRGKSR